jgi:phage tail-like protein
VAFTPGINVFFRVTIDAEFDLGAWTSVTGLGIELATEKIDDSGMSFFQHKLPGHIAYSDITLKRQLQAANSDVINWLSSYHLLPIPTVGEIAAVGQDGSTIASWQMVGVSPVKWQGPEFDAGAQGNNVHESLTIAHMGFL